MEQISMFCQVYGNTIPNRILEYMLENQDIDFAVSDMAKELNISKPKAYEVIKLFGKNGIVEKSRLIGKTQLYALNKSNYTVQVYLRNFKECLNMVISEYDKPDLKPLSYTVYQSEHSKIAEDNLITYGHHIDKPIK